jgi:hypothetical protein
MSRWYSRAKSGRFAPDDFARDLVAAQTTLHEEGLAVHLPRMVALPPFAEPLIVSAESRAKSPWARSGRTSHGYPHNVIMARAPARAGRCAVKRRGIS